MDKEETKSPTRRRRIDPGQWERLYLNVPAPKYAISERRFHKLDTFIEASNKAGMPFSAWVKAGPGEFYLRSGERLDHEGVRRKCLTMASSIVEEEHQRKGIYTQVLDRVEQRSSCPLLFHENVLNPFLAAFLERRGYRRQVIGSLPCYFKLREVPALGRT